jgi:hypothetical protein
MRHHPSPTPFSRSMKRAAVAAAAVAALAAGPATANAATFTITPTILPPGLDMNDVIPGRSGTIATTGYTGDSAQATDWVGGLVDVQNPVQVANLFAAGLPAVPGALAVLINGSSNSVDFATTWKSRATGLVYKDLGGLTYSASTMDGPLGTGITNEVYGLYSAWGDHDQWEVDALPGAENGDYSGFAALSMRSFVGDQITLTSPIGGALTAGGELKGYRGADGITTFTPTVNAGFVTPLNLASGSVFVSPGTVEYGANTFGLSSGPAVQAGVDVLGFGVNGGFTLPAVAYDNGNIVVNTGSVNAGLTTPFGNVGFTTPTQNISVGVGGVNVSNGTTTNITTAPRDITTVANATAAAAAANNPTSGTTSTASTTTARTEAVVAKAQSVTGGSGTTGTSTSGSTSSGSTGTSTSSNTSSSTGTSTDSGTSGGTTGTSTSGGTTSSTTGTSTNTNSNTSSGSTGTSSSGGGFGHSSGGASHGGSGGGSSH